jgi:hypothetical protein
MYTSKYLIFHPLLLHEQLYQIWIKRLTIKERIRLMCEEAGVRNQS